MRHGSVPQAAQEWQSVMELSSTLEGEVLVVSPVGDLNAASCGQLEAELAGHAENGRRRIVLDLSQIRYVSSAGLRVFLVAARRHVKDGSFVLANPSDAVAQILKMTGFDRIVRVEPSLDQALAAAAA
jgi:stage II sporulation protein AA (anti-sigma F factor antagonist)